MGDEIGGGAYFFRIVHPYGKQIFFLARFGEGSIFDSQQRFGNKHLFGDALLELGKVQLFEHWQLTRFWVVIRVLHPKDALAPAVHGFQDVACCDRPRFGDHIDNNRMDFPRYRVEAPDVW